MDNTAKEGTCGQDYRVCMEANPGLSDHTPDLLSFDYQIISRLLKNLQVGLIYQVTLADPADGRVAGHLTQGFDVVCQKQGFGTDACGCQSGFCSGMSAADHDYIKVVRVIHCTGLTDCVVELTAWVG